MNSKPITIIKLFVAILLLFVVVFIAYRLMQKNPEAKTDPATNISYRLSQGRVYVNDLHKYADGNDKRNIERSLFQLVDNGSPELYTAVIREDSVTKEKQPSGQVITQFITDIQPADITYKVTAFSRNESDSSIRVECVPKNTQINPNNTCNDITHE